MAGGFLSREGGEWVTGAVDEPIIWWAWVAIWGGIIEPEVEVTSKGTIVVPTTPGIGYSARRKRIEQLTARQQVFHGTGAQVSVEGAVRG